VREDAEGKWTPGFRNKDGLATRESHEREGEVDKHQRARSVLDMRRKGSRAQGRTIAASPKT